MNIDMVQKVEPIRAEFARYGFTAQPLQRWQIAHLINLGFNRETIYQSGCDWAGKVFETFADLVEYYKQEGTA